MSVHDVLFHLSGSNLSGVNMPRASRRSAASASSTSSSGSTVASLVDLSTKRTKMDIRVDHHFQAKVYASGDVLTGTVTITPARAMPFEAVEIALTGTVHTTVHAVHRPLTTSHVVLKMVMPPDELAAAYPAPRVLDADRAYAFRFHFVVPAQLTLGACKHPHAADAVRGHHMRLPPSLGGGSGAAWAHDDMAPDMVRVEYAIKARVWRQGSSDGSSSSDASKRAKIVEATHPLRVLPTAGPDAAALQPVPTTVPGRSKKAETHRLYKFHASKTLRKGLLGGRQGRLTAAAGDGDLAPVPAPLVLRHDGSNTTTTAAAGSTAARVHLRFEPASPDTPPPQITGVAAKLGVHTFFSQHGSATFPDRGDWVGHDGGPPVDLRGDYTTSVALPLAPAAAQTLLRAFRWQPQADEAPMARKDSGYSDGSGSDADKSSKPSDVSLSYSGLLDIPVDLPLHRKMFVPTFHSCLASRTYVLHLAVTVAPGSKTSSLASSSAAAAAAASTSPTATTPSALSTTTIDVAIPVQIVVAPSRAAEGKAAKGPDADEVGPPSFEDALEEAAADAHLQPRVLAVPDQQYQGTSELPGYRR